MNSRIDGVGRGFLVTHVAFDGEYIALAGKGAAQSTVRKIDDADLPSRRDQMAGDGVADAFAPPVIRATGFAVDMLWLFGRSIAFDGKVGASAPFRPGTVVETF